MRRPSFLILHGYQGSGPGHWQTWLAGRLRAADARRAYPDLPDADPPQLRAWLDALEGELDALGEPPVVHLPLAAPACSGCTTSAAGGQPAARVLLVAPPSRAGAPEALARVLPASPDDRGCPTCGSCCSDDDPYCPEGAAALYAPGSRPTCSRAAGTSTRTPGSARGRRSRPGRARAPSPLTAR